MRNYKKNGNTETFDIYAKAGYEKGKKKGHITIVTDPNLDIKAKELDYPSRLFPSRSTHTT